MYATRAFVDWYDGEGELGEMQCIVDNEMKKLDSYYCSVHYICMYDTA